MRFSAPAKNELLYFAYRLVDLATNGGERTLGNDGERGVIRPSFFGISEQSSKPYLLRIVSSTSYPFDNPDSTKVKDGDAARMLLLSLAPRSQEPPHSLITHSKVTYPNGETSKMKGPNPVPFSFVGSVLANEILGLRQTRHRQSRVRRLLASRSSSNHFRPQPHLPLRRPSTSSGEIARNKKRER